MIYQTDPEFGMFPAIAHGGCFFLSILRALSDRFNLPFTHESVIDFYKRELSDSDTDVDTEMFVGNAQNLIDDFVGVGKVKYLGALHSDFIANPTDIIWGSWHRSGVDFNHFTLGRDKPVIYDPYAATGSASVAIGRLVNIRAARML